MVAAGAPRRWKVWGGWGRGSWPGSQGRVGWYETHCQQQTLPSVLEAHTSGPPLRRNICSVPVPWGLVVLLPPLPCLLLNPALGASQAFVEQKRSRERTAVAPRARSGAALKEPLQAAEVGLLGSRPERGADPLGGGAAGRGRGRRNCWASRRWEEERSPRGVRWTQLEHRGPCFAPPYEPLPDGVRFYYDGEDCPGPPATAGRAPPGLLLRRRWGCPWGQGRPGPWETLALRPEPGRAPSKSAVERPPEGSATEVPSPAAAAQGCSCQAGGGWARPCVLELAQLASAAAAFPLCPRACSRTTLWVRPGPWGLGAGCPRAPGRAAA